MKFHDELNPKLWDKIVNQKTNEEQYELKTEVADKLKEIAQAFIEYLDINEEAIKDVVITGSSASYNYTPHSDLDLHLKVDYELVHEDCPLVENYLFALKGGFNKVHNISIYGIPVEVYAENIEGDTVHNGLYSLWQGKWIDIPRKIPPTKNDEAVLAKYNEIKDACNKIEDSEVAEELLNKIYEMRKAGLSRNGEFSTENLTFKKLRDNGIIDRLKQMKKEKIDKQLTLESYKESIKKSKDKNNILPYIKSCLKGIKGIIPNDIYIDTDMIININNGANVTKIKEQIYNRLKDTWVKDYLKEIKLKQGMLVISFKESITEEIDREAKMSNKNEDINTLCDKVDDKDKELKELIQVIKSNKHEDTDIISVFKELGKNIISNFKQNGYPKTDKFLMDFADEAIQEFEQKNPNYKIQLNIDNGDLVLTLIDKQNNKSFYQLWINGITKRVKYSDLEDSNYMFENINRNDIAEDYINKFNFNKEDYINKFNFNKLDYTNKYIVIDNNSEEEKEFNTYKQAKDYYDILVKEYQKDGYNNPDIDIQEVDKDQNYVRNIPLIYEQINKQKSVNEKVEETKNYKRTRLAEPNTCKEGSFRTKQVNDKGDKIILCKDKETNKIKAQSKLIKKNEELEEPIKINSKVKDKTGKTGKVIGVNVKDKTVDVELDNTVTYDNDELELLEFFKRRGE